MSKTISFVASDELADYLEEEAERRMTTVSSTAQMLLAEIVRAKENGREGLDNTSSNGQSIPDDSAEDELDEHPDVWYRPGGESNFAVRIPPEASVSDAGETRYYDTREGAAQGINRWYV